MEIDIISYTPAQYAALSEEQILEVKGAQLKKNRLQEKLNKDIEKEKYKLMENGTYISPLYNLLKNKLTASYNQEVENIREGLLFYLRYGGKPNDTEASSAPYTVDYSLSDEERLEIVRTYYETAYTDADARFNAFKTDEVAPVYLGELYAPLYDYFLALVP